MKRVLLTLIAIAIPALGFSNEYTGKINKIKVNQKEKTLTFQVEDGSASCAAAWFWIKRPNAAGASAAELIVQSYFSESEVSIIANRACPNVSNPAKAQEVSVGLSKEEKQLEAAKYRDKITNISVPAKSGE